MTVDRDVFLREFELLEERFNRKHSDPVVARYHAYLDAHLTTEQFEGAAIAVFNEERYFPAPHTFVERALGSLDDAAAREWGALYQAHLRGERAEVSDAARRAWSDVGGAAALNADGADRALAFLRRDFVVSYRAHALPKPPGLLRLEAGDRRAETGDRVPVPAWCPLTEEAR